MKRFWQRSEKIVKVEIVNQQLSCQEKDNAQTSSFGTPQKPPGKELNFDLSLKVLAFTAVVLNSCLAIMGYVDFTGYLQAFGISTNELDLSLSTLLFQGYIEIIVTSFNAAADHSLLGALAILIVMTCIFLFPVSIFFKNRDRIDKTVAAMMIGYLAFIVLIIPLVGLHRGEERANKLFDKQNSIDPTQKLKVSLSMKTKEGVSVSGETIFASPQYTYILQRRELYKIANRDNHIVSIANVLETPKRSAASSGNSQ
ncbi:hypothetical protein [Pseudomonas sp. EL_65y_Pfl2_R96]|uniref:hypothetical protein n=1 Tax=Pseudomonas sp. EL_65y_Pfl2_R96 TaxID=3088699 RepID=UPI0030D804F9